MSADPFNLAEHRGARAENMVALAEQRPAAYKRLKQIFFVPTLPRSASGKLLRLRQSGTIQNLQTVS